MRKILFILISALIFSCAAVALSACGGGQWEIRLDDTEIFFEYGKEASIPDASVYDKDGNAVEFDVKCEKIISPSGDEIEFTDGNFISNEIGEYTFVLSSASAKSTVEIKLPCRDTIDPELTMDVPVEFIIKDNYDAEEFCDLEFPSFKASDLSGIKSSETKVFFGENKQEIFLSDSGTFKITEEGPLYFYVKVTDNNGRSKTTECESYASLPERFEDYCLSSFNRQSYVTKAGEGWGNAATSRIVTVLESNTDGKGNSYDGVLKVETAGMADNKNHPAYLKLTLGRSVKREDIDGLTITYRIVNGGVDGATTGYDSVWYAKNGYWEAGHYNLPCKTGENYKTISIENNKLLDQLTAFDGYIKEIRLATFGNGSTMEIYIADISYIPHDPTNLRLTAINFDGTNGKGIYLTEPLGIRVAGNYQDWATIPAEGTVLFNGAEIQARLQVTEHGLGDNVIYLTNMANNLGATNGDIVVIKTGYGLTVGDENLNTKRDYAYVFNGAHAWTEVAAEDLVFITVTGGIADKKYCAAGEKVTLTVNESAIPVGKEFSHWTLNGEIVSGNEFTITANAAFVANYSNIVYTVEITGGTANKTSAIYGETVTFTVDENAIPTGKIFYYWTVNGTKIDDNSITVTANLTVEATYGEPIIYAVQVTGGTATVTGESELITEVLSGTSITFIATSVPTGYRVFWTVNGERINGNVYIVKGETVAVVGYEKNISETQITLAENTAKAVSSYNVYEKFYLSDADGFFTDKIAANTEIDFEGTIYIDGEETNNIRLVYESGQNIYAEKKDGTNFVGGETVVFVGVTILFGDTYYAFKEDYGFLNTEHGVQNTPSRWRMFTEECELLIYRTTAGTNRNQIILFTNIKNGEANNSLQGSSNQEKYFLINGVGYNRFGSADTIRFLPDSPSHIVAYQIGSVNGDVETIVIKKGFAVMYGGVLYRLANDFALTWDGNNYVRDIELTLDEQHKTNANVLYLLTDYVFNKGIAPDAGFGTTNLAEKLLKNGEAVEGATFHNAWDGATYIIDIHAEDGDVITLKAGFSFTRDRTTYTLQSDISFRYSAGAWALA